jgi:DNA-binding NarL/FixJ family response regulator
MDRVADVRERVRRDFVRLVHRGLGMQAFAHAVNKTLRRAVPFEGTCLLTMDPATLLPTGHVVEGGLPGPAMVRLNEIELREADVNKFTHLARLPGRTAGLSLATRGELDRSLRQRELRRPSGFEDELRTVLSGATGAWGALTLLREAGSPHFTPADVRFVASLSECLADGVRRAMLVDSTTAEDATGHPTDTGLLVLTPDDTIELSNRAGDRWLDELAGSDRDRDALPMVVRSVANRARTAAQDGADGDDLARARLRTSGGRWALVRATVLSEGPKARTAVLLEAAGPPEMAPLIADRYDFTERERSVTELVARGLSTNEIAARLHLSVYTVQDHLKSVFTKSGSSSRGDLVARLFFDHYAPRLSSPRRPPSR